MIADIAKSALPHRARTGRYVWKVMFGTCGTAWNRTWSPIRQTFHDSKQCSPEIHRVSAHTAGRGGRILSEGRHCHHVQQCYTTAVSVGCTTRLGTRWHTGRLEGEAQAHQRMDRTTGKPGPTALWCAGARLIIVRAGRSTLASLSHPTVTVCYTSRAHSFRIVKKYTNLGISATEERKTQRRTGTARVHDVC